jgi:hypothetical protein
VHEHVANQPQQLDSGAVTVTRSIRQTLDDLAEAITGNARMCVMVKDSLAKECNGRPGFVTRSLKHNVEDQRESTRRGGVLQLGKLLVIQDEVVLTIISLQAVDSIVCRFFGKGD